MNSIPSKPKILLIEDEESVRKAIKITLNHSYYITELANTQNLHDLLEKEHFDLVLLDMFIVGEGEEGSLDTLKTINKKYPTLPVIILTGSVAWINRWQELRDLGAAGYLSKPFDRDRAVEIIEKCLKGEKMKDIW